MQIDRHCDFHMHTSYSDGTGSIEDMTEAAISVGLRQITITDHMPLPFATYYAMEREQIQTYRREISAAQRRYSNRLQIKMGLEMEYIETISPWIEEICGLGWDSLICSIHYLPGDGQMRLVNGSLTEFNALYELHGRDGHKLCRTYYETLQAGYATGLFNIAGHLDVINKYNSANIYFDEDSTWYRSLVDDTLESIKQQGMSLEINTGGFNHPKSQQYPNRWIIDRALAKRIPLVLSSDAHNPQSVGQHFNTTGSW